MTAFALLATPQIRVLPSVIIDPQNSFGTQLAIVNQGRIPVYDLHFSCNVNSDAPNGIIRNLGIQAGPPISIFWPNQTATRNCSIMIAVENAKVYAMVRYRWPIIGWHTTAPFLFALRKGSSGFFLVPDVE